MSQSARAEALVNEFLDRKFDFNPDEAVWMGLHEYDGRIPDLSLDRIARRIIELEHFLDEINEIEAAEQAAADDPTHTPLDAMASYDLNLVRYDGERELFRLRDMKVQEKMPIIFSGAFDVTSYIKRDYAPFPARVRSVIDALSQAQQALADARENLEGSIPRSSIEVALRVYEGHISYLGNELTEVVKKGVNPRMYAEFEPVRDAAVAELKDFVAWLKGKQEAASDEFALGEELYARLLHYYELIDMPVADVLAVAQADLKRNKDRLDQLAKQMDASLSVPELVKKLGANHPSSEELVAKGEERLEHIRKYIIEHKIITIPSEVRCVVEESPSFMSWSFASMAVPGPFEDIATQSYYYLTRPQEDWSQEKKDEWLSQFAYHILDVVSVHEAYPGHYVQFLHMKHAPTRASKCVYATTFVEGWAHYTEEMMVAEQGFEADDPRIEIAQLLEALVRNVRFVNSILMHTQGETVEEATQRFINDAYMEEASAYAEAIRGTFDPGYFAYTVGKLQIYKLRRDYEAEQGEDFNLQEFHDKLLSLGSPPLALIRPLILREDNGVSL